MDLIKIGKFISEKRKEKGFTQSELAEKLFITDRAISKWENGICLPDVGNMSQLCEILDITINDLFSGEVVDMKETERKLEENLLEMTKLKEESDKRLLDLEVVIGVISTILFCVLIGIASLAPMEDYVRFIIVFASFISFIAICLVLLRIEQVAGYYECANCHHKYVPTYLDVNKAQHIGRKRKMKCPKCGKKTWQKKVIK